MKDRTFAIDLDGVLYDFRKRLCQHLRQRWNYLLRPGDIHQYNVANLTGVKEIDEDLLFQIRKNPEFYLTMEPLPGAQRALRRLKQYGTLIVVSNRPAMMRATSLLTLARDFPDDTTLDGLPFRSVHLQDKTRKYRIARAMGAEWAVDDNPTIAEEYAKHRVVCFLVNAFRSYRPHRYIKPVGSLTDVPDFMGQFLCAPIT